MCRIVISAVDARRAHAEPTWCSCRRPRRTTTGFSPKHDLMKDRQPPPPTSTRQRGREFAQRKRSGGLNSTRTEFKADCERIDQITQNPASFLKFVLNRKCKNINDLAFQKISCNLIKKQKHNLKNSFRTHRCSPSTSGGEIKHTDRAPFFVYK